jgi:hypothetical protein
MAWMTRAVWAMLVLAVGAARGGDDEISRLRARVAERTARIPNYTCLETIDRRWYATANPASGVADRLRIEVAAIEGKEQFAWPGGSRFDSQELQEVLGHGLTKSGDFSGFLSAIFGSNSASYALAAEQAPSSRRGIRYDYRVPQTNSTYLLKMKEGGAVVGFHGSFWVDPGTLDLVRIEIEADDIPPALKTASVKLAIDYGLVAVGAGSFLLPQTTGLQVVHGSGLESRTTTRFAECRQFIGESSISFEERPVEQAVKENDPGAALPAGTILEVALTTPIDKKTAATGDMVEAELRKEVKTKGGIVVPKGAVVEGRIVLLERRPSSDSLMLRFTNLRFGAGQVRLRASVVRCAPMYRATLGMLWRAAPALRDIDPRNPIHFVGGFLELPKGLALTLETEAVAAR